MFRKSTGVAFVPMLAGVERRTMVSGDKTLLAEFRLSRGHIIPRHAHPHEQTGYLVHGRLRFVVGTETFEAQQGDAWCVPGGIEHGVEVLEDSLAIEVFAPRRDEYL
ncbi:MAG: cupin domain-containing protein [Vicinamibacteria bacterium]|jgi:quercetin dioxygenase-like cupin family protein|nr:cupin domain-containing protein [Vicinamibacteria bacterium]